MDLNFVAGSTFVKKLFLTSLEIDDLTDYTVYLEVRKLLTDAEPFISMNSDAPNDKGSVINISIAENSVEMVFTSLETIPLTSSGKDTKCFWDLRFVHTDGTVKVLHPASNLLIQRVSTRVGKDLT